MRNKIIAIAAVVVGLGLIANGVRTYKANNPTRTHAECVEYSEIIGVIQESRNNGVPKELMMLVIQNTIDQVPEDTIPLRALMELVDEMYIKPPSSALAASSLAYDVCING